MFILYRLNNNDMQQILLNYKNELSLELIDILTYWTKNTLDLKHGGFIGQINAKNIVVEEAPKGVVLNARILWTYSAAYNHQPSDENLKMAERAYHFLENNFFDQQYGGVYWSVNYLGTPLNTKKQVYAISFVIYALAEFYKCSLNETTKKQAIDLYHLLLKHAFDQKYGGFIEALTQTWKPIQDYRLSDKDTNTPKSMNTLLHVLEAFTNLYKIWPEPQLKVQIQNLLILFDKYVINKNNHHLHLFFNHDWSIIGNDISFGHDIEAAWLLLDAAKVIEDDLLVNQFQQIAVKIATSTINGLDADGGLWYESNQNYTTIVREKHWWPQAESMVGFFNAFQITGKLQFLQHAVNSWEFVKKNLKDHAGEWHWGILQNGSKMNQDKAGFWKCPYHNARACLELINRINFILKNV